jgi:hypothetical protein
MLMPRRRLVSCRFFDRLPIGDRDRSICFAAHCSTRATLHPLADYFRHRFVNGAGVSLFLGNAELGQHVDDRVRGDLKLPCELIDSNFTHK